MISAHSHATEQTRQNISASAERLPMDDTQDFADAERGFIARSAQRQILTSDGGLAWDLDAYSFLDAPVPDTANPSLWRQGQLCAKDGLFEVRPGIYQARGFDLSNVTFIEGTAGVIVVDPLTVRETAAAAFELYASHRGRRPVTAVIYSHSHIDHFGGVKGIVSEQEVISGRIPVIAPAGFMEHAVAENVFAGTAMARRAGYMYGAALRRAPDGQIGAGLGQSVPRGETTLIAPTLEITHTGQELSIDGVRIQFQVTPGTEAPAEMNFYFRDLHALCSAENTSHTLHNILTIRGAPVRDAHAWAHYLTETIALWGNELEVVFASHHWPTWEQDRAVEFLKLQRDLYLYLHDQTLRLINQGYVGEEIAEQLELPPALQAAWHTHGYYGSVSHNVKAIYQRYLGWYDGNPAHLWKHPPVEAARRYVAAMGGATAAVEQARQAYREGDYRWVVELLNHVLFADETQAQARELQADAFEQLGFGAENGTWRSAFLAGAEELRRGRFGTPTSASADIIAALTVPQLFDAIAIRVDGPRAWNESLAICWVIRDDGTTFLTELRNGVFSYRTVAAPVQDATVLTLSRQTLMQLLTGSRDPAHAIANGDLSVSGDPSVLVRLVGLLAPVDPNFAIVTP